MGALDVSGKKPDSRYEEDESIVARKFTAKMTALMGRYSSTRYLSINFCKGAMIYIKM